MLSKIQPKYVSPEGHFLAEQRQIHRESEAQRKERLKYEKLRTTRDCADPKEAENIKTYE